LEPAYEAQLLVSFRHRSFLISLTCHDRFPHAVRAFWMIAEGVLLPARVWDIQSTGDVLRELALLLRQLL